MKSFYLLISIVFASLHLFSQEEMESKIQYLKANRQDLNQDIIFPQSDFKVLGFGAVHGSSKTEEAEIKLLRSLLSNNTIEHYIMEADYSLADHFNIFLNTGDKVLLKDLVFQYGIGVPQEQSIETYNKWIELYDLNKELPNNKKIKVLGIDLIRNYKYSFKHILALIGEQEKYKSVNEMSTQLALDTIDYSPFHESASKKLLRRFVKEIEKDNELMKNIHLKHIVENIKTTFEKFHREKTIFNNYKYLLKHLDLKKKKQYFRYGFFHIQKEREHKDYPSFFTMLIENNIYKKEEIVTVLGYLTKSQVLWDTKYDDQGKYAGYTTKAGYGISDYWKEYFKGIRKLKKTKVSDLTLYRLNQKDSPYHASSPDLMEIKMIFNKSNKTLVKGKATTLFLDYAILISDSPANQHIKELEL